jgi:hypothetical protein
MSNLLPENLTIIVLLGLAITAALSLGVDAKDVLIAISSGLVGYLTRGAGSEGSKVSERDEGKTEETKSKEQ